jgi:retinol dehydrogenase 12
MLYPAPYGALTQLYAGTSPEGAEFNGKWLIPWARVREKQPNGATDENVAKKVWEEIERAWNLV